jgi:hypothetical protein
MASSPMYDSVPSYRRHVSGFRAAADAASRDDRLAVLPPAEQESFLTTFRQSVGSSALHGSILYGLMSSVAIDVLSTRLSLVKRFIVPRKAVACVSIGLATGALFIIKGGSWGLADPAYAQVLASSTSLGAGMRDAYGRVAGDTPFLQAAAAIAASPAGAPSAPKLVREARFRALQCYAPDPTGATTLAQRVAVGRAALPSGFELPLIADATGPTPPVAPRPEALLNGGNGGEGDTAVLPSLPRPAPRVPARTRPSRPSNGSTPDPYDTGGQEGEEGWVGDGWVEEAEAVEVWEQGKAAGASTRPAAAGRGASAPQSSGWLDDIVGGGAPSRAPGRQRGQPESVDEDGPAPSYETRRRRREG